MAGQAGLGVGAVDRFQHGARYVGGLGGAADIGGKNPATQTRSAHQAAGCGATSAQPEQQFGLAAPEPARNVENSVSRTASYTLDNMGF
jgi:hypothetical protein